MKSPEIPRLAGSRLARMDQIKTLVKSRGRITGRELAQILEVSPRQLQRDIFALMLYGVPIISTPGPNGGYSLPDDYVVQPDMFNHEEAKTLSPGGQAIFGHTHLVAQEALQTALAKITLGLPKNLREEAERVAERVLFDHSKWYQIYYDSPLLEDIKQAVLADEKIILSFKESEEGEEQQGQVYPYGLICKADVWYLVGYLHEAKKMRRFNLTRVSRVERTNRKFKRTADFSLIKFWEEDLEQFGKGTTQVRLLVSRKAWEKRLKNLKWKKDNVFEERPNGIQVTMYVDNWDWVVDLILVNRGEVIALEPADLKQRIEEIVRKVLAYHMSESSEDVDFGAHLEKVGLEILEVMSIVADS